MTPRYALKIMDRTLRDIMILAEKLSYWVVILDNFCLLKCMVLEVIHNEIVNLSIKFSSVWKYFINYSLTQNMRVLPEETEFAKFLLDIGNGIINYSNDNIQIPECCIAPINADIIEETRRYIWRFNTEKGIY